MPHTLGVGTRHCGWAGTGSLTKRGGLNGIRSEGRGRTIVGRPPATPESHCCTSSVRGLEPTKVDGCRRWYGDSPGKCSTDNRSGCLSIWHLGQRCVPDSDLPRLARKQRRDKAMTAVPLGLVRAAWDMPSEVIGRTPGCDPQGRALAFRVRPEAINFGQPCPRGGDRHVAVLRCRPSARSVCTNEQGNGRIRSAPQRQRGPARIVVVSARRSGRAGTTPIAGSSPAGRRLSPGVCMIRLDAAGVHRERRVVRMN